MHFDESFFLPETKNDFYIKSMMKRYWASSMESLYEIDRICRKNNIKYYADYGTLLGAVRHKGFIPWDDDIDVSMLRVDYEKFIKCALQELREPFRLFNVKESVLSPMRVVNTFRTTLDEEFLKRFHLCPYSTGVDVYVLDKIPTSEGEIEVYKVLHTLVRLISQYTDPQYSIFRDLTGTPDLGLDESGVEEAIQGIEELSNQKIDRSKPISPQLAILTHNLSAAYYDTDSQEVANIQSWVCDDSNSINVHCFDETVDLPFENMMVMAPANYTEVLTQRFGPDYMTPLNLSASHSYPAYKELEQELFQFLRDNNISIPSFLTT